MTSVGPLCLKLIWGWGTTELGVVLTCAGVIQVVSELFIARRMIARYGEATTALAGGCGLAVTVLTLYMSHNAVVSCGVMAVLCQAWGLVKSPLIGIVGRYAPPATRGTCCSCITLTLLYFCTV